MIHIEVTDALYVDGVHELNVASDFRDGTHRELCRRMDEMREKDRELAKSYLSRLVQNRTAGSNHPRTTCSAQRCVAVNRWHSSCYCSRRLARPELTGGNEMAAKNNRILGSTVEQFVEHFTPENGVFMRSARLIPTAKIGDEMALTSSFLAAMRIIDPFRKQIFSAVNLPVSGSVHYFTEVEFKSHGSQRVDGMILIEKAGKIADAAFLEMKNDNNELDSKQLKSYFEIAKQISIPKVITVSNQFVSHPQQSPVSVKVPKGLDLYHLSWSYILTVAHLLLLDNDVNIDNPAQAEVMREVIDYFDFPKSGIRGFNQMKPGWKSTTELITASATIRQGDADLVEAVESWIQEENDMALILSRELGLFVRTGEKRFRNDYSARVSAESKNLVSKKRLRSRYKVQGAASDIDVEADFGKRTLSMIVTLDAPQDKQLRGQVGWLKQQLKRCAAKSDSVWKRIENELSIDVQVKYGGTERTRATESDFDSLIEAHKGKSFKSFSIVQVKDFGKSFSSPKKYVEVAEEMFLDFYQGVVQNLKKWEPPAPPMQLRGADSSEPIADDK